jgi:ADP-ribose pyrophosphatase YjhB (NUDIX family)
LTWREYGRFNGKTTPAAPGVEAWFPEMTSFRARLRSRIAHFAFLMMRPMTLGVRAVVIDDRDSVLLVRHGYVSGWHFPGGGVEVGETCADALGRELEEEARVAIVGAPVLHGLFFNPRPSRRDHVAVYIVPHFKVLGERTPDREIEEARFFPLRALPEGTTPGTRARLAEIVERAPLSAQW